MFDVALFWLIIWVLKNAAMDVSHAVKGTPNPRYELKKAKAKAAGQAVPAQPRYGSRDWFNDLLSDGLQAQTDWRRRKADEKRKARELAEAEQQEQDEPVAERDDQEPGEQAGDVVHDGKLPAHAYAGKWSWSCRNPKCPGKGFDFDTEQEAARAAGQHRCLDTQMRPAEGVQLVEPGSQVPTLTAPQVMTKGSDLGASAPVETSGSEPGGAPIPEQHDSPRPVPEDGPTATVYPFPTKSQEDIVSTEVTSEVTGLDQSINYARSLAAFAGEHEMSGNEGYIGHLTQRKVTGQGLQSAYDMQAAFEGARVAAEAHATELEKQRTVQEAYDQAPDAGDKQFQTEGR
ncbi:hypothetical protein [Couchioplanes caeruleus]|uniref:Uncharacterized protein n=2 Tax=Couchioplanes caeruleus TaxID=56438 RepID=A0A1K0FNR2_9ACTN|nr:hypothetical protein [Couchioplanes caeruleus]OJF14477.1 hypothetical protein BG844_09565 [Couchioplanes caeruleus subsp. caeruleus]ROP21260.1 hypothetical protein EDD30_7656 [Couchioplanes caeruleus]